MSEFWNSALSGVAGGLIVLLVQKGIELYEKYKRDKEGRVIKLTRYLKTIPNDILDSLEVGISLEKMKEILGIADIVYESKESELFENGRDAFIYLYHFSNGAIKVASKENNSIDTITIFSIFDKKTSIRFYPNPFEEEGSGVLGKTKLSESIFENNVVHHFSERTARETYFGVEVYYGRMGGYLNYTYFGRYSENFDKYEETKDPKHLVGALIEGFCISNDEGYAPYISEYEMR